MLRLIASPLALVCLAAPASAAPTTATEIGLIDLDGRPITLAEHRGKWIWLYLGFASCPDACPRTLDAMVEAYAALPEARRKLVQPFFVSVDPQRDDPARLKKYLGFFHPDLRGGSGPRGALDALVAALGTRYELPADAKPGGNYQVGHPNEVFVIDPKGRYVARLDAAKDDFAKTLAADLEVRLATPLTDEAPPPPPSTTDAWCGIPSEAALADPDPLKDPRMHRAATMGSGTAVLPGATPMRMWATKAGDWLWMGHLQAVAGYNRQGGPRGGDSWVAENWQMVMGSRYWAGGLLDLRAKTSLEPWTLPPGGTHQLFQAGETWRGQPLIDRQHPHELFMELASRYTWTPDPRFSLFGYGALVGDPALGPSASMHRPSAADNAWTPLGHHLQDASHVSFGVATAGARLGDLQLEGSVFNGREPDEDRLGLDLAPLDSWSARLSWFPGRNLAAQVSHGLLRTPHRQHPGDEARTSASLTAVHGTALGRWSNSLIWGRSAELIPGMTLEPLHSFGLESQLDRAGYQHYYARGELFDRTGLPPLPYDAHVRQRLGALTLGYAHDLGATDRVALALGGDMSLAWTDAVTATAYGPLPLSFRVYLRLRPPTYTHPDDRDPVADGPT